MVITHTAFTNFRPVCVSHISHISSSMCSKFLLSIAVRHVMTVWTDQCSVRVDVKLTQMTHHLQRINQRITKENEWCYFFFFFFFSKPNSVVRAFDKLAWQGQVCWVGEWQKS